METDETVDPVQPDEGQGGDGETNSLYAEYLDGIPEEARGPAEEAFKAFDANTTRKFQDHAEFRKGWEPYEQTGINQYSPEEVQWLAQFRQALDNPEAIQQWYEAYAQQAGIQPQQQQQQQLDPDLQYQEPGIEDVLKQHLSPIEQQLQQFSQWREQQEYQGRLAEAERHVSSQIEELKTKHPGEFNEEAIEKLVAQYIESDPQNAVTRAFSDWQAIRSQIEKDTLQAKVNAPPGAESGGVPDGAPEQIKTLEEASQIAEERFRQARQA